MLRPNTVRAVSRHVSQLAPCPSETVRPYQDIPGPKPLPIIGNTWRFFPIVGGIELSDVASVSQKLYDMYGKIVRLSGLTGRPDLVFIFDPDEAERVYRAEGDTPYRPSMPCIVKYKTEVRKDFFGELPGVIGVHGEPWREFRTRVQKPILQPRVVKQYIAPIESVTEQFIQRMLEMKDENNEMPDDFDNEIHKWSLECIGRIALDVRLGCLDKDLPPDSEPQKIINAAKFALRKIATLELKAPYWRYFPTTTWRKYIENMDYFRSVCMKYIQMALENLKKKDSSQELSLLERILQTEKDPKIACILALDLILVGIDTISMAVCSVLYQLATRPEEQKKLYQELNRIMPDPLSPLTTEMLDNMVYLKSFIKEVLRMYSTVIGIGRVLQEDTVLCGYSIPKGIQLVFPTIVMGSMEGYVSKPHHFLPERWMKRDRANHYIHPFASLPYGFGARMCLGRRFADLEMQILLAKLIRAYNLQYHHEPLEYKVTFMYAPHGNLKLKMTKWEDLK